MTKFRSLPWFASCAVLLGGCNVESTFHGTGGVSLDGGETDGGHKGARRGVAVVSTDYSRSSVVSLLSSSGEVRSPAFIGSGSAPPGLSAPFSGDVVLPTMALPGDEVVLIDGLLVSVLSWVNLETAEVRAQLSVRTGFLSNPRDYVPYSARKAFVTRYEPNLDSGLEPFDSGNDVLIVDPSVPEITGSIDLMPVMEGAPAGFYPRADRGLLAGGKLRITANSMDAAFSTTDSRIVTVDPESDMISDVFVTEGLHNCRALSLSPDGTRLAVACTGRYNEDPSESSPRSGVLILAVGDKLTEVRRFTAGEWGIEQIIRAEWTSPSTLLVSNDGRHVPELAPDALRFLDLDSGVLEMNPVLQSNKDAFVLGGAQCDVPAKTCFVPDAETERGVLHELSIGSGGRVTVERTIKLDTGTGLPPRYLGAF